MNRHLTTLALVTLGALSLAAEHAATARAANTAPAIEAFDTMFAGVHDYTFRLHSHEVQGSSSQNRVYQYAFLKPHFAKTLIESGDGSGSGGVWAGGDQISGHQGGFLSGIHLKVGLHDGRAVSLRGYTIPEGLLQNMVQTYADVGGMLTQTPGGDINGIATDRLELKVTDPQANAGITRQVMYLSQATHWPMREIMYVGDQIVLDQQITDIKSNTGLTESNFPF